MKKSFLLLWSAGVVSSVLALPYVFALQQDVLAQAPLSPVQIGLVSVTQAAVLLAVAVSLGLWLAQRVGFPVFAVDRRQLLRQAVPLGIAVALVIRVADIFFTQRIPALAVVTQRIAVWKGLLAAPYGGIVEELLMRLFLVSLFAWLLGKVARTERVIDRRAIVWTSILLTAVLFGVGHLPATATFTDLTPLVIARAILLNGLGGVVFGWLYWRKGLPAAMVSHATADIVLHGVAPLLFS